MNTHTVSPLKRLRVAKGYSQLAIATKAGVHLSTISLAERSGRLTADIAERIASALGVDVNVLKGGSK